MRKAGRTHTEVMTGRQRDWCGQDPQHCEVGL